MVYIDYQKVLNYINSNDNLKTLFNYYLNNCISLTNPYHNANHTMQMMYHICCIYEESQDENYEFKLDNQGLYILLLAALFHDYNHSAGRYNDITNVTIAIEQFKSVITNTFPNDTKTTDSLINIVQNIIAATCYPYIIKDEDLDLYQRIIRECDILVGLSSDHISQCLIGLKDELRVHDWNTLLSNQTKFLLDSWNNLKLSYSKKLVSEHSKDILTLIDTLCAILK